MPPPAAAVTGDGEEPKEDSRPVSRGRGKKGKKVTVKPVPKHEDVAWWRKVKPLLDEGKSERDIAAELGISPALVNKIKATWEGRDGC